MFIHSLAGSVPLNYRLSVAGRTASRFYVIFRDTNDISEIYLAAKLTITLVDNFLLKRILSNAFSNDHAACFFAVTQMYELLQVRLLAKMIFVVLITLLTSFLPAFLSSIQSFTTGIVIVSSTTHRLLSLPKLSPGSLECGQT